LPKDSTFGFSPSSFFLFLFLASFVNALIERVDFFVFFLGGRGLVDQVRTGELFNGLE
jgi:hypothetical protein